ncbi:membrane protein insertase YidC [Nannocystis sp. ILAH1]|uniref:membrane protein insertase YidC n=1 Tax=Nannocystis sp. ILAH1 TaxID=2996789 RepID=UPI002271A9ED|nr:membrane protein insertase YidC [Nannocystis sp. ILAH1]
MDLQRRTLLAIVSCVLIWLVYERFFAPPLPEPQPQEQATSVKTEADAKAAEERAEERKAAAAAPKVAVADHRLKTELLALDVTNHRGLVRGTELLSKHFINPDGKGEDFLKLDGNRSLVIGFDGSETDFKFPRDPAWEPTGQSATQWAVAFKNGDVEVKGTLDLTTGYEGTLTVDVANRSAETQQHRLTLLSAYSIGGENSYDIHRGVCATADDWEAYTPSDVKDSSGEVRGRIRWAALDSKYFASAVVPAPEVAVQACRVGQSSDGKALTTTLAVEPVTLAAGESHQYVFGVYFGTKELERLEKFQAVPGVHLEDVIDWGWFGGLNRILGEWMIWLLRAFYNLTGVWGVAIILLTIVVKVLTLPLTFKQMRSMKKMREIQPELEDIKKKYGEDRVRQAQEMQALFQRAGVNPLAGCLPMLIQLPIWIALYATLNTAVELYRVPFLWLPDLTQQDPYYILPLAMGALMYIQMKATPSGVDNEQARMMAWMMPIIFTVMMLFLPSGLGVYIFANVLLSLIQTLIQVRPTQTAAVKKS